MKAPDSWLDRTLAMNWPFPPPDKKRFDELVQKSPDEAISIWLQGDFTIGEERLHQALGYLPPARVYRGG